MKIIRRLRIAIVLAGMFVILSTTSCMTILQILEEASQQQNVPTDNTQDQNKQKTKESTNDAPTDNSTVKKTKTKEKIDQ